MNDNVLVRLKGVAKSFDGEPVLRSIDLDIHDNVIAQSRDGALITECAWSSAGTTKWHMMKDAKE